MPSIYDARSTREWCDQETVGESFYRTALNDIRKHVPINEHNVRRFAATLVLEMDNPIPNLVMRYLSDGRIELSHTYQIRKLMINFPNWHAWLPVDLMPG